MTIIPEDAEVRIYHCRRWPEAPERYLTKREAEVMGFTSKPLAKGGRTIVRIQIGGASEYGTATCSNLDNYSRSKGRMIAIGRAMKALGLS